MLIFVFIYICICAVIGYFLRKKTNDISRYFILLALVMTPAIIYLLIHLDVTFIIYPLSFISLFKLGHTIIYLYNSNIKYNIIKYIEGVIVIALLFTFFSYMMAGTVISNYFIISLVLQISAIITDIILVFLNDYLKRKDNEKCLN